MFQVIQEVIDPQTKIVFSGMNDKSVLLRVRGTIHYFLSKSDFQNGLHQENISHFSRDQIISAFERTEALYPKKSNRINTALDGMD
ncbi:MAG: hypothetical protein Q8O62_13290 [Aequorivita sp.]|nr:hypothetical protein [Aequorivita sp.]